ncbi:MAG: hypothetical protein JO209_10595 [Acidisphaera sp.]|nr:hypothetical protein [Acidisphaera sp.]
MKLARTAVLTVVCGLFLTHSPKAQEKGRFAVNPIPAPGNETFPDPFPILDPSNPANRNKVGNDFVFFSTQDKAMSFPSFDFRSPSDVTVRPISVDVSFLQQRLNPAFRIAGSFWAKNVFYDQRTCAWHMIASAVVAETDWQSKARSGMNIWPKRLQTSIVHLSPDYTACSTPLAALNQIRYWRVDKELIGRIPTISDTAGTIVFDYANYAGKLVQDRVGDPIYLIYVKRLGSTMAGIVAQPMLSPDTVDTSRPPITLLAPDLRRSSEYRDGASGLQIIETANVVKIRQTWALLYTTGNYRSDTYKIGIAYSDRLTGPYEKVLARDLDNVWRNYPGGASGDEVVYLLQGQNPNWFNFIRHVKAPGVPTILMETISGHDQYFMTFAGYPQWMEPRGDQQYNPAARVAYFAPVSVNIPNSASAVASSGSYDRAHWVELQTQPLR